MPNTSTESQLRDWRYGSTQAERLSAALLQLEGFESVDPQHPLGGPDGLKDVICRRDGKKWVAAAYFPPTIPSIAEIKAKFDHDIAGVVTNAAQAFAFFVNQYLTISERESLLAGAPCTEVELYHLERIRVLLDSPKGCGLRLQYLRIAMSEEEQWAFWSVMNYDIVRRLAENERAVHEKLDLILKRTTSIEMNLHGRPSSILSSGLSLENVEMPTASFTAATLCWIHRLVTEGSGLPEATRGRYRAVSVWIGEKGQGPENARFVPPPPEGIPSAMNEFVHWWTNMHFNLTGAEKAEICRGLAELHHQFLTIHPFLDANGQVARAITDQGARELLNQSIGPDFLSDPAAYYDALQSADAGDLGPLTKRISAALI